MDNLRIVLWTGGDAPSRDAKLKVSTTEAPYSYLRYMAIWEPGYCGCEDCYPVTGWGSTPGKAIADYWEQWSERYE